MPMTADQTRTMTLEAFADTIIPGERRVPGDRAVAGASAGGGAVAAGAVELLETPAGGLTGLLDNMVVALNEHARTYAAEHGVGLDDDVPAFVALPFRDRTTLVQALVAPEHPEKELWVSLVMFSNMAFDTGAHMHTTEAFDNGHPGLLTIGFERPDPDGIWRFPEFSYGRPLANLHPDTTATGSPA
jgi:enediyne biosynthesis protein E8